jgi:hypothetical protein
MTHTCPRCGDPCVCVVGQADPDDCLHPDLFCGPIQEDEDDELDDDELDEDELDEDGDEDLDDDLDWEDEE